MSLQSPQKLRTRTCEFEGSGAGKGQGILTKGEGARRQAGEEAAQSPAGKTGPEQRGGLRTCAQSRVEKIIWETEQMQKWKVLILFTYQG